MDQEENFEIIAKENIFDILLRYGLYFGALFHLVCIGACIYLPYTSSNQTTQENFEQYDTPDNVHTLVKKSHYRFRKQDKKKRR